MRGVVIQADSLPFNMLKMHVARAFKNYFQDPELHNSNTNAKRVACPQGRSLWVMNPM